MSKAEEQFTVEQVVARAEINHRVLQFARGVDRRDLDLARQAFHPDATDSHGAYVGAVAGLFKWTEERHKTMQVSHHQVGNVIIEFVDESNAFVESYVLVWQSVNPTASLLDLPVTDEFEVVSAARYADHFRRRDGAWRIQTRLMIPVTQFRVPPESQLPYPEAWLKSTRDEADPAQALRTSLGL